MTEEGSRVELVDSFLKIYDMKVKWSRNRMYKILIKNHQHLPKVSIGVGDKNGKKKPMSRKKKEPKIEAKKKLEATSIREVQPTNQCVSLDSSSQPKRPKGRPRGHHKNEILNLPSQLKKPKDRLKKKVIKQRSTLHDDEIPTHNREVQEIAWCGIKISYEVDQGPSNVNIIEQHTYILTKALARVKLCIQQSRATWNVMAQIHCYQILFSLDFPFRLSSFPSRL